MLSIGFVVWLTMPHQPRADSHHLARRLHLDVMPPDSL